MGESPRAAPWMDAPVQLQLTTSLRNKHRDTPETALSQQKLKLGKSSFSSALENLPELWKSTAGKGQCLLQHRSQSSQYLLFAQDLRDWTLSLPGFRNPRFGPDLLVL